MPQIELTSLKPLETAVIAGIKTEAAMSARLLALGFRAGREIKMLRKAPFGGPVHVRVGTTEVMLRRRDAQSIHLVKTSPEPK
jgi:ferrous iron transport protein A